MRVDSLVCRNPPPSAKNGLDQPTPALCNPRATDDELSKGVPDVTKEKTCASPSP